MSFSENIHFNKGHDLVDVPTRARDDYFLSVTEAAWKKCLVTRSTNLDCIGLVLGKVR